MAVDVLSIRLLGSPSSITWQDKPFQMARRQVRALLYRLAVSIEPVPRQQLCFLFWPDLPEAQARRNLNRLLSYLHQTLPDREILALSDETVSLSPHLIWSDADEFQKLLQNEQATGMQRAIDLYRGSFLQGFYLPHSPEYDFWLTEERERFESRYLALLAKQVDALMDAGDFQQAIPYAQNYLKIDNLAEELHRRVIVCQAALGNRAAAKAQYEQMASRWNGNWAFRPCLRRYHLMNPA